MKYNISDVPASVHLRERCNTLFIFQCCESSNVTDIKSMHFTGDLEPWSTFLFHLFNLHCYIFIHVNVTDVITCDSTEVWLKNGLSQGFGHNLFHSPQWLRYLKFCYTDMTVHVQNESWVREYGYFVGSCLTNTISYTLQWYFCTLDNLIFWLPVLLFYCTMQENSTEH